MSKATLSSSKPPAIRNAGKPTPIARSSASPREAEHEQDAEGDDRSLTCDAELFGGRPIAGEGREDRRGLDRVEDHEERHQIVKDGTEHSCSA